MTPVAAGIAPSAAMLRLPPLPRPGDAADGLSPNQRRLMVAAILAAHVAGVWGLLQVQQVREAVREAAPMFVDLIAPAAPPAPPPPPPPPAPQPILKKPLPAPVIAAAPSPAPAAFVVAPPSDLPQPPAPPEPVAVVEAPPAPPAPAPAPKMIPASAIQYLVPPEPEYPRLSRRNGEAGTVIVRAFADEAGLPHQVQVERSSGFVRLDEAAMAAVRKTRFKPYTENGKPVAGWVRMPFPFELEK
ncbi:MAG: energy transducer TonB [Burkholderiales bacterium]